MVLRSVSTLVSVVAGRSLLLVVPVVSVSVIVTINVTINTLLVVTTETTERVSAVERVGVLVRSVETVVLHGVRTIGRVGAHDSGISFSLPMSLSLRFSLGFSLPM